MRSYAVVDCETPPFKKGRPADEYDAFIWGFYDGERYEEFTRTQDLVEFLQGQEIIVYAHNGGKFDWHFILDYIEPFTQISIIAGRLAKFKIGLCEFRDSYNILPVPLRAYAKDDFDYTILEAEVRHLPGNWKKIQEYLYHDCKYLFDLITAFVDRFGMHLTVAGAAMKHWEKVKGEKAPHDKGGYVYQEFSRFYYGGRCQSFELGEVHEQFDMLDINSAYARAMLDPHPYGFERTCLDQEEFEALPDNLKGSCFVDIRAESLGAFPFRDEDDSLTFPADGITREFAVTGWEYLAARDTGTLGRHTIAIAWQFSELQSFEDYILPLYEERIRAKASGDKATDILCKIFCNGLYGKWCACPAMYSEYMTMDQKHVNRKGKAPDDRWSYSGELGPWALMARDLDPAKERYYHIGCGASITGWVRAYLWRAICQCEGVLYCDTDSIAARDVSKVPQGTALGEWKNEGRFDYAALGGKKMYAFRKADHSGWKLASKGVKLTPDELIKVARGEVVEFETDKPTFSVHKAPRLVNRKVKMKKK